MEKQYKFSTLEELEKNYKVGSIFSQRIERHINANIYYSQRDLIAYKNYNDRVEVVDEVTCLCYKTVINKVTVSGYLYDGTYWYPAGIGYDGWYPLDESDLFDEEEITFDTTDGLADKQKFDKIKIL